MGLLQKLSETGLDSTNENKPALDKPVVQKKSNSVGLFRNHLWQVKTADWIFLNSQANTI